MKKNTSVSALFWSSADKILTNGFALVISIILARLIAPSEYGVIATASIFTVLLALFVEPGMTSALIQKKDSDELDFSTILTVNIVMGIGLYAILFFLSGFIANWFELPILSPVLRVLGLQILLGSYNSVQIAYVQRNMLFKRYFVCSITSAVIGAIIALIMAYLNFGVWALVVYNLVRYFVNTVMVAVLFGCRFKIRFSKERFIIMFPFAGKMLLAKFIDQGYVEVTQTIISKSYSSTDLAFYNKGKSFPDLLISNLNTALGNVLFPFLSKKQEDFEEFKSSIRTSIRMTSFVCFPMLMGLMACSENFIRIILTDTWVQSVPYMQLICFYYLWVPFSNIIWQSLKAIGKSNVVLQLEIIKISLNILLLVTFLYVMKSPIAVALSIAVSYALSFFVECHAAIKHLKIKTQDLIHDFLPSFILSTLMGIVVYGISFIKINIYISFILQVFVGMAFYIFMSWVFRFPQMKTICALIKRK